MGLTAAMTTLNISSLSVVFQALLVIGGKIILGSVVIGGLSLSAILPLLIVPPMLKIFLSNKKI